MEEAGVIRFAKMAVLLQLDSSFSYVRRLPPADSVVKAHMIRFVGLPFVLTSGGSRRTDAVKQEMIRFVEMTVFSEVQ